MSMRITISDRPWDESLLMAMDQDVSSGRSARALASSVSTMVKVKGRMCLALTMWGAVS